MTGSQIYNRHHNKGEQGSARSQSLGRTLKESERLCRNFLTLPQTRASMPSLLLSSDFLVHACQRRRHTEALIDKIQDLEEPGRALAVPSSGPLVSCDHDAKIAHLHRKTRKKEYTIDP